MKTTFTQLARSFLCAGATLFSGAVMADVFPLKADDLALTHRYKTSDHATGANQGMGKDIIAMRPVAGDKWNHLVSDTADKTVNANHLIYGRKVYAMVSGTVVNCWRNAPDNSAAGTKDADVINHYIGVGGNALVIKTAEGVYVKHSHLAPGTMPTTICPHNKTRFDKPSGYTLPPEANVINGAKIVKGQFIGLAGNSGNSTMPHLHVHMFKDDAPHPMKFEHGQTTPFTDSTASLNGPWTLLNGSTLPTGPILVWAPRSVGNWTINNVSGAALQGWSNHMRDSGHMPDSLAFTSCSPTYNTQWVPVQGSWYAKANITATEMANLTSTLAGQGYQQYKWWYCNDLRSAIWRK